MRINNTLIVLAVFFSLLALGQLGRFQINSSAGIYFHDALIVGWLIYNRKNCINHLKLIKKPSFWSSSLLLLVIVGWIRALLQGNFEVWQLWRVIRLITYSLFVFNLIHQLPNKLKLTSWLTLSKRKYIGFGLMTSGLLSLFWGFAQYLLFPDTRILFSLGWDDHYFRLIGTQLDPNFTGIIIVLTILISLSLIKNMKSHLINFALLLGLIMTFSRASMLAGAIGVSFLVYLNTKRNIQKTFSSITLYFIAGAIFFVALPKPTGEGIDLLRTSTISSRRIASTSYLREMSSVDWIIGKGVFYSHSNSQSFTSFTDNHAHQPDNLFITLISGFGIVGTILISYIFWKNKEFIFSNSALATVSAGTIMIHSMFNNTLFQAFVWLWLMTILAMEKISKAEN